MERRVHASSESDVFAGKDGGGRHPHDSGSICPGRWADMTIASPHLVHLHAPPGWPPRHLGGMTAGLATRWCSRNRTQITGSEPPLQLAIKPDRRLRARLLTCRDERYTAVVPACAAGGACVARVRSRAVRYEGPGRRGNNL